MHEESSLFWYFLGMLKASVALVRWKSAKVVNTVGYFPDESICHSLFLELKKQILNKTLISIRIWLFMSRGFRTFVVSIRGYL